MTSSSDVDVEDDPAELPTLPDPVEDDVVVVPGEGVVVPVDDEPVVDGEVVVVVVPVVEPAETVPVVVVV